MTQKRFVLEEFGLNFIVNDNGRQLSAKQTVDLLNDFAEENEQLKDALNQRTEQCNKYYKENEHYKSIFFELVETALTDKNCRELYCKGILGIFDKANSLNQARDMIKEHMN